MLVIELNGDDAPASAPGSAVNELALSLGMESQTARRLRVMVDELVSLARRREHGDRPTHVRVRAWSEHGRLRVEVSDRGIPIFNDDAPVAHELVRLGFVEQFELRAHGRDGNIATCSLPLSGDEQRDLLVAGETILPEDAEEEDHPEEFVVRAMEPTECAGLARLVYRCYGYGYPAEDIYYPDRMGALIRDGLMHSAIILNRDGEMIGHAALTKARAAARVAEAGKLVVDPRYRSHGLAKKLADFRIQQANELELLGLWTECVTNHPYSQRNQLKLGAVESGIFLGIVPADVSMVGLENEPAARGSLVPMYLPLPAPPERELYAPPPYGEVLSEIVKRLQLPRDTTAAAPEPTGPSRLSVSVNQTSSVAVIDVETVGTDLVEQCDARLTDLEDMRIDVVYLDLPLADPGCAALQDRLSNLGFFFSALLPESGRTGDTLRLQLLDHVHVPTGHIKLASEWGEALLSRCDEDRQRVEAQRRRRLSR